MIYHKDIQSLNVCSARCSENRPSPVLLYWWKQEGALEWKETGVYRHWWNWRLETSVLLSRWVWVAETHRLEKHWTRREASVRQAPAISLFSPASPASCTSLCTTRHRHWMTVFIFVFTQSWRLFIPPRSTVQRRKGILAASGRFNARCIYITIACVQPQRTICILSRQLSCHFIT